MRPTIELFHRGRATPRPAAATSLRPLPVARTTTTCSSGSSSGENFQQPGQGGGSGRFGEKARRSGRAGPEPRLSPGRRRSRPVLAFSLSRFRAWKPVAGYIHADGIGDRVRPGRGLEPAALKGPGKGRPILGPGPPPGSASCPGQAQAQDQVPETLGRSAQDAAVSGGDEDVIRNLLPTAGTAPGRRSSCPPGSGD